MKRTHPTRLVWSCLLASLVGCGDSLVSGEAMDDLLGLAPNLQNAGWEVRWVGEEGLSVACELLDAEIEIEDDEAVFGTIEIEAPELEDPPDFNELEEGGWALALLVLVDVDLYEGLQEGDDIAPLEPEAGVWGVVEPFAVLFVEGDVEAMGEELFLDPDELPALDEGQILVELVPEVVEADETVLGAMEPLSEQDAAAEVGEGMPVTEIDVLSEDWTLVFTGEVLGGAQPGCDR